jgi:hypothetical protein
MNILFFGYWGIDDGLTTASILPHLEILNSFRQVERIFFCTIEREKGKVKTIKLPTKVTHIPVQSGWSYLQKVRDFTSIPQNLSELIESKKIDGMICRGTPAGALGYLIHQKTNIPYCVESVEPHADYMLESNVWKRWGIRYQLQKYWEKKQYTTASLLMPVAKSMVAKLISEGTQATKIDAMPCAVDLKKFAFSIDQRNHIRDTLQIPHNAVVGIYVGKFGGLYYDHESFEIFRQAKSVFSNFRLIILTPHPLEEVKRKLNNVGFKAIEFNVLKAKHEDVPAYLSAADFAFALYKKLPSNRYLSPIKVGEYWAIGLPVLLTEGTGDDAEIILENKAGDCFDPIKNNTVGALVTIKKLLDEDRNSLRERINLLAHRYRNFEICKVVYRKVLQFF